MRPVETALTALVIAVMLAAALNVMTFVL